MTIAIRRVTLADVPRCARIEEACFPGEEAAPEHRIRLRAETYPEGFFVATAPNGEIVGLLNSGALDQDDISDEELKDLIGHDPRGAHAVVFSVAVDPAFQGQGIGTLLIEHFTRFSGAAGRRSILLLCKANLVPFYRRLAFEDQGLSASRHGGVAWHQMRLGLG